jgi:predicted transposase/invertase (TIGR01784 family)
MEIHFIELPKLADDSEEKDLLVAWLHFLKNPGSEKVRDLEKNVAAIGRAKDELIKMSNNEEERLLYRRRLKYLSDAVSNMEGHYHKGLAEGREEGRQEGREEGMKEGEQKALIQVAISLLDILDDQTIADKTGLTVERIQSLRKNKI